MSQLTPSSIEIRYFRKGIAITTIAYFISLFYNFSEFFGADGWIKPELWNLNSSLFLLNDGLWLRWISVASLIFLLCLMFMGKLNRFGLAILYGINLTFYLWNPLIIHEPQPLMNLFLLSFFLLPLNDKDSFDPVIKYSLIIFLGIYYFWAGVKKLPDASFLNGVALESILSWPTMAKNLQLNLLLVQYFKYPIRLFNYLTLIFETGFIFLAFTRFRIYLILFGLLLHSLIYITLEVGNFSWVMMAWYLLLLDQRTLNEFSGLKQKIKRLILNSKMA